MEELLLFLGQHIKYHVFYDVASKYLIWFDFSSNL